VTLGAGGAAALVAYAAFALPQGGPWLPASVLFNAPLMQSRAVDPLPPFAARIPEAFLRQRHEHLPVLLIAIAWLLLPRRRVTGATASAARVLLVVTATTILLHAQLAGFDGFFRRYEAYWMMLGCFGVVTALAAGLGGLPDGLAERLPSVRPAWVAALFALGVATPFVIRGHQITYWTPRAAQNIYEQQIQMARFVDASFRGRVVAINDLGAVGYFGGARVIDLCGLASPPVVRAIIAHRFDTAFIERYCREEDVDLAMLYESWFRGAARLPDSWTPVARWTIRDNLIAGDAVVTVFATDSTHADVVRAAERRFAETLPPRVIAEPLP
ncbi:MAG TPA: hypothetical protein VJY35_14850, partial [Candidatus Eisenbacteria bacterium]|nr:hypothetical protein [Candidatus Eisenbacteria bacterium]